MHTRIYVKKLEASKLSARGKEASSSKSTGQPEDRENRARYQSWSLDHELRALDSSLGLALWGLLDHNPANDLDFDSERAWLGDWEGKEGGNREGEREKRKRHFDKPVVRARAFGRTNAVRDAAHARYPMPDARRPTYWLDGGEGVVGSRRWAVLDGAGTVPGGRSDNGADEMLIFNQNCAELIDNLDSPKSAHKLGVSLTAWRYLPFCDGAPGPVRSLPRQIPHSALMTYYSTNRTLVTPITRPSMLAQPRIHSGQEDAMGRDTAARIEVRLLSLCKFSEYPLNPTALPLPPFSSETASVRAENGILEAASWFFSEWL
ncbi:hypothetical protein C8J57DRAFT_1459500 [Mycena rebaudengoi]|nr:hypothetical protein C8J57DRAFT_1459500 [Mycena rebaudengoi]